MMPILSAICFIAWTMSRTARPPSTASLAALPAMLSVIFALSVFCAMEADICSTEAPVSSTLAACSVAAWLSDCEVALTSSEAEDSESAALRTSVITARRRSAMFCMEASRAPVSSLLSTWMSTLRSPSASALEALTARFSGRVMLRVTRMPMAKPISEAMITRPIICVRESK